MFITKLSNSPKIHSSKKYNRGVYMTLHKILTNTYPTEDALIELAMKLGYKSPKKGVEQLQKFIDKGSIEAWLSDDMYDFKHTALSFVETLSSVLGVETEGIVRTIAYKKAREMAISKVYVEVVVHFKRTKEQVMVLMARQSQRTIKVNPKLLANKNNSEIFDIYAKKIQEHYEDTKGDLGIWGKTHGYDYYHIDGKKYSYSLDDLK